MGILKLSTHLEYDKIAADKSREVHLLVTLEGGKVKTERKPLALSAVIDVSGSMASPQKINYARQTLEKLVDKPRQ